MHTSTFEYLKPTNQQLDMMAHVRNEFRKMGESLEILLPDGADKAHVMRQLRDAAMWANIAITRHPDGSPRE